MLNAHPAVSQSVVVGRQLADGNEEVVAFVELAPGQHGDVRRAVRARGEPARAVQAAGRDPRAGGAARVGDRQGAARAAQEPRAGSRSFAPLRLTFGYGFCVASRAIVVFSAAKVSRANFA